MSVLAEAAAAPRTAFRENADARLVWLAAFAAAAVGAGLGRAVTTTYLPLLLDEIKDAPGLIGTAMLVNAAAGFAVPLVIGVWSDRRGRRIPFVLGGSVVAAGGAAAVALGSGSSYLVLAAAGAIVYVGLNAITTAHRALVPESFAPDGRARATSAQELALLVGTLLGVVAGGALTEVATWAPFVLAAAAMPLLALPTALRVADVGESVVRERERRGAAYYLRAAARPGVRALLAAQILWVLGYAALPAFFILFADRELGLSPAVAALWLGGFGLVTGAAVVASGRVADPARHKPLLQLGVALLGSGLLTVYLAPSLLTVAVGLVAAAAGFGLVSTLGFPLFSGLIPAGEAGGYTALYFSVRAISSAAALPAVGWAIAVADSYRILFLLGGLVTLAALAPLARIPGGRATAVSIPFRVPSARWWLHGITVLAWLYAAIALSGQVVIGTSLQRLDETTFRLVNGLGHGPELLWDALNPHTRNYVLLNLLALTAAALTRPRRLPHVTALLTLSWLLALGLLEAVYALYDRPRPSEVVDSSAILLRDGWTWAQLESFPSGHMAITAALAAATALAFPRLRTLLWAYVAAVAFTRVLFGAHFPADVLVGIVLGYASARAAYAFLAEAVPERAYERTAQSTRSESRTGRKELAAPS